MSHRLCGQYFIHLLFYFYCYGDHRDLHSFPTRRSSDLHKTVRESFQEQDNLVFLLAAQAQISELPSIYGLSGEQDRKSTRLNSSHTVSSYAVFCLKKKINSNEFMCID